MQRVGFIGMGNMGISMAGNLVKNGFEVKGFDLSSATMDKCGEHVSFYYLFENFIYLFWILNRVLHQRRQQVLQLQMSTSLSHHSQRHRTSIRFFIWMEVFSHQLAQTQ